MIVRRARVPEVAEKLKIRIRASLQRCRKCFEFRVPFSGCIARIGKGASFQRLRKNSRFVSGHRFSDAVSGSNSESPLGTASRGSGRARVPEVAEKPRFVSGHRFSDAVSGSNSESPLGAASRGSGRARVPEVAEKPRFVSGHRFSDAVSGSNSESPLGAASRGSGKARVTFVPPSRYK